MPFPQGDELKYFSCFCLWSCGSLRDVILHAVKRSRRVQKPLRAKTRFQLRDQRVAFGFRRAFRRHAAHLIRRPSQRRAKIRASQSAQPRQRSPADLVEHFPRRAKELSSEACVLFDLTRCSNLFRIFVGRGFSRDINQAIQKGLSPLT
jgi:hypothetical protein